MLCKCTVGVDRFCSLQNSALTLSIFYIQMYIIIFFSLIDRRGFVVPECSPIHDGMLASSGTESNAVKIKHENYGSTTQYKVLLNMP